MLGLIFAPAGAPKTDLNLARVVGKTVTQTEQNRECSASLSLNRNGQTKFRKFDVLCFQRASFADRSEPFAVRLCSLRVVRSPSGVPTKESLGGIEAIWPIAQRVLS
jgi:hypothetical protein